MEYNGLIDEYIAGPQKLRAAIAGMTPKEIDATPVPGRWSTRQVVCHLADFEPVYADRMKRVIAENEPMMISGDPDVFAAALAYDRRDMEEELQMMEAVRRHVARILRSLKPANFQRKGIHSTDGPLTLATLLERVTVHIPHHIKFIEEKRAALSGRT
jgi:hypothetical protein